MHKSFLKWAGGKFDLVEDIKAEMPAVMSIGRYIEPFLGGGAVALNMPITVPKMLNDINPGVVEVWTSLKRNPKSFVTYAASFFQSGFYNTEARYYKQRDAFNFAVKHGGGDLTAGLFLYLNRHCFNGLCRFNKKGEFNVPYGRYKTVYFPEDELRHAGAIMQNATISQTDFRAVMALAGESDVVFCDPPYVSLSKSASFTAYSKGGFSFEDQIALADCAVSASKRGATVIITNHDTADTRALYKHADSLRSIMVKRRISCKGQSRQPVKELIATYRP